MLKRLLKFAVGIDRVSEQYGHIAAFCVLAAALISAGNAFVRYGLDISSNGWLEIQWYLFSAVFLLCSGYALLHNQHVRIDIVLTFVPPRIAWLMEAVGDVLGFAVCLVLVRYGERMVVDSVRLTTARPLRDLPAPPVLREMKSASAPPVRQAMAMDK